MLIFSAVLIRVVSHTISHWLNFIQIQYYDVLFKLIWLSYILCLKSSSFQVAVDVAPRSGRVISDSWTTSSQRRLKMASSSLIWRNSPSTPYQVLRNWTGSGSTFSRRPPGIFTDGDMGMYVKDFCHLMTQFVSWTFYGF